MFASIALATRIDRAEMRLTESVVRVVTEADARAFVQPIGGGVAGYAGPMSPMNKMIGVGFDGVPPEAELAAVEAMFEERKTPLQAEVSTLADPAFAAHLTRRGYVLQNFENVSGRPIVEADRRPPDHGIRIDLTTPENVAEWIEVAITGFQQPDGEGVAAADLPPREVFEAALGPWAKVDTFRRYCAWIDGSLAGVATLRIDDGIAQLCGAATAPPFRRRGVQAALLRARLADAAEAKCELAVVTTQPGSTSQKNVERRGFGLLYPRAVLVKG
jgi:ribosomal protein S18 acetylase RimI-like enzyme